VHVNTGTVLLVAFVGFFLFIGFAGALILLALEGRKLHRHRQISFDPVEASLYLALILLLLAIIVSGPSAPTGR